MMGDWQSFGLLWLRALAGLGMATHGFAKIFGGGMAQFEQGVGQMGFPVPALFAWAAALSEFAGAICMAVGLGTRIAAGFVVCTMSVALFVAHAKDPFSTKEMAYLYWTISGAVLFLGGGRYTLGRALRRR